MAGTEFGLIGQLLVLLQPLLPLLLFPVVLHVTWLSGRLGVVFILVLSPTVLDVPHQPFPFTLCVPPSRPSHGPHSTLDRITALRVPRPQHGPTTHSPSCATTL